MAVFFVDEAGAEDHILTVFFPEEIDRTVHFCLALIGGAVSLLEQAELPAGTVLLYCV